MANTVLRTFGGRSVEVVTTSDKGFDLAHGARTALRANASAYAYSVFVTCCFGLVNTVVGDVTVHRIFLFLGGATVAFASSEALVSRGFRDRVRPAPSDVVMLGSAMAIISVTVAAAVSWFISEVTAGGLAWFLAPFGGTVAYILFSAVEMAVARREQEENPPEREK